MTVFSLHQVLLHLVQTGNSWLLPTVRQLKFCYSLNKHVGIILPVIRQRCDQDVTHVSIRCLFTLTLNNPRSSFSGITDGRLPLICCPISPYLLTIYYKHTHLLLFVWCNTYIKMSFFHLIPLPLSRLHFFYIQRIQYYSTRTP